MKGVLAVITARGGSKRIPRKNIKDFLGKPIIAYSIDAALRSGCFDEVMVSTDDTEIAKISEALGAGIPFFRSKETAGDMASTSDVVVEVVSEYKKRGREFECCCCIYPTAPFISAVNLRKGFDILLRNGADSVIPVVRFGFPAQWALQIKGSRLSMVDPEKFKLRSQDLEVFFHDVGQFYWLNIEAFMKKKELITDNTCAMEIPESMAQDIDTEEDWKMAEIKYRMLNENI